MRSDAGCVHWGNSRSICFGTPQPTGNKLIDDTKDLGEANLNPIIAYKLAGFLKSTQETKKIL
jgi:hypothetical protein